MSLSNPLKKFLITPLNFRLIDSLSYERVLSTTYLNNLNTTQLYYIYIYIYVNFIIRKKYLFSNRENLERIRFAKLRQ